MTNVQLRSGDVFHAHVTYDGTTLTVTLDGRDRRPAWSVTESYAGQHPIDRRRQHGLVRFHRRQRRQRARQQFPGHSDVELRTNERDGRAGDSHGREQPAFRAGPGYSQGRDLHLVGLDAAVRSASADLQRKRHSAAQNTTATFSAAGTYILTVTMTDAAGDVTADSVTVTVDQRPTAVVVTPSSPVVSAGTQQSFSATLDDQFGDAISGTAFTWAVSGVGTVDTNGNYTASAVGTATLSATSSSGLSSTATIDVMAPLPAAPVSLTAAVISAGEIDLSWPAVIWATGYNIFRGSVSGGESTTPLNTSPVTGTGYDDKSVSGQTTYYYVVRAVNATGRARRRPRPRPPPRCRSSTSAIGTSARRSGPDHCKPSPAAASTPWPAAAPRSGALPTASTSPPSRSAATVHRGQVASVQCTSALASAGLMFRDSTAANAAMAMLAVAPSGGLTFETRATNGGLVSANSLRASCRRSG